MFCFMQILMYSSFDPQLPKPIAFSGWKHHLGFISYACRSLAGECPPGSLVRQCQEIGGSVIDLYYGKLTPICIATQIVDEVLRLGVSTKGIYNNWVLGSAQGYRMLTLSDSSVWVLRLGRFKERYIHIHPARCSPSCLRVRATTLKTLMAYLMQNGIVCEQSCIEEVNTIRQTLLNLPPLTKGVLNHRFFTLAKYVNR